MYESLIVRRDTLYAILSFPCLPDHYLLDKTQELVWVQSQLLRWDLGLDTVHLAKSDLADYLGIPTVIKSPIKLSQ